MSACEQDLFVTPNRKQRCPNLVNEHCSACQMGLCWAHTVKCSECGRVFCRECHANHNHQRKQFERVTFAELEAILKAWPA